MNDPLPLTTKPTIPDPIPKWDGWIYIKMIGIAYLPEDEWRVRVIVYPQGNPVVELPADRTGEPLQLTESNLLDMHGKVFPDGDEDVSRRLWEQVINIQYEQFLKCGPR